MESVISPLVGEMGGSPEGSNVERPDSASVVDAGGEAGRRIGRRDSAPLWAAARSWGETTRGAVRGVAIAQRAALLLAGAEPGLSLIHI